MGQAEMPRRRLGARQPKTTTPLRELIDEFFLRHNINQSIFAEECGLSLGTLNDLLNEDREDRGIKAIRLFIQGLQTREPSYPIERIYQAFDLPVPRMTHPAMQPRLPAHAYADPIAALQAVLDQLPESDRIRAQQILEEQAILDEQEHARQQTPHATPRAHQQPGAVRK